MPFLKSLYGMLFNVVKQTHEVRGYHLKKNLLVEVVLSSHNLNNLQLIHLNFFSHQYHPAETLLFTGILETKTMIIQKDRLMVQVEYNTCTGKPGGLLITSIAGSLYQKKKKENVSLAARGT